MPFDSHLRGFFQERVNGCEGYEMLWTPHILLKISHIGSTRENRVTSVFCLFLGCLSFLNSPVFAQLPPRERVYATKQSCETAGLTAPECKNAFENAAAELDEKAPSFASRAACEKHFRRCMIGGFDFSKGGKSQSVIFRPSMRGVEIIIRTGNDRTARPLLEINNPNVVFQARSIVRPDISRSPSKRAQAQARWKQFEEAAKNPPSGGLDASKPIEMDLTIQIPDAGRAEKPLPPPDPAAIERRRERLRNAPFIQ